ncbi:MAG: prolyl oligopeptidase family serine peptidase [Bacteroidales bacterium]|nr:prolyl oligopeptidase family serine peptidase [Bacteroidales bacterium]
MRKLTLLLTALIALSCAKPPQIEKYTIEQFYKNTRFGGGVFSPDETKMLISSDETGIFNVFEIDLKDGSRKQITFSEKESFFAVGYVSTTGEILYSADKGGNEISHIYLLKSDSTSVDLTPGEEEKVGFWGWSEDKQWMYYTSNKRDNRYFDLYKMRVEEWTSEMIYENDKGLQVSGFSDNENYIALTQPITTSENKLFLLDRSTGEMVEISDQPGSYDGSGFSKDNKYFYYITNVDKEFAYLVQYEMATGNSSVIYETNWDVMYSYLSENETYRVIAINEDGRNKIVMLNNSNLQPVAFPEIADGNVQAVRISESEKQMRLTIGTSKSPNNIYVYNFENNKIKKLTHGLNEELNPGYLVTAEVVRYKSFDGVEIPAIYYKPLSASNTNKVPALVWVHGGPGGQSRVGYFALIQYLVNNGYALLAVNNRGSSGYGKTFYKMDDKNHGDKDLKDCIWGKKWLQNQDYIDTSKIGIIGGSYGGYMTMAAMTFTPDEFKVGVNIFGVTNWLRTLKSIPPYWESFRNALYAELGDPFTADSVRLYNISPLFHAENVKNPVMVLQGANDPRVLQVESDEIVEAVKKNDVHVEYVIFPDEGHGFRKKENEIEGYGKILTFLDTYLKGAVIEE